jgi:hypothetical protein
LLAALAALVMTSATPAAAETTLGCPDFFEDFEDESLARWAVVGRRLGSGSVSVAPRGGSKAGHVFHQSFTEIGLSHTVGYSPDCVFEFDMEASVSSQSPPAANYYASAGVSFSLVDAADTTLGTVSFLRATTSFVFDQHAADPVRESIQAEAGFGHYRITAAELLSLVEVDPNQVARIVMTASSYGSTYPYPLVSGDVWFDNVRIGRALPFCRRPTTPPGAACDNGNDIAGDTCLDGICVDAVCNAASEGASCDDSNACTENAVCQAGACVGGTEPCRVELPCAARGPGGCSIDVICTGPCQVSVSVAVRGRRRARCRAVLVEVSPVLRDASSGAVAQANGRKKARKISRVAKGTIDESGAVVLKVKLNKVGRALIGKVPVGAELPANAEITIKESKRDGGEKRLLNRLVKLVRK